jgi:serine/threonine-protein kinase
MLGKYERLDVLGHGASGIVYLARDTLLNKQIALKEVDVHAGDVGRFLEEARVMDRLRHPNIVRVNGVDRIDGKIVIDMEYVRGRNLQEILRSDGKQPVDKAVDIAIEVLDALDYAHTMQTVHRDIKPANILIDRDGSVKLVDFGLAEILATNAYAGGAGTYAYMAPEDFAEDDRSDSRSDIWAVGVTLFEMLTGQRPYVATNPKDPFSWKRAIDSNPPALITDYTPDAPDGIQQVLDRALARAKRDRYESAGEFRDDLKRFRAGLGITTETIRVAEKTQWLRSNPTERISASPVQPQRRVAGADVVVAEVSDAGDKTIAAHELRTAKRSRLALGSRDVQPAILVEPAEIDLGTVRYGETASAKVQVKTRGVNGDIQGAVTSQGGWLATTPSEFARGRQTVSVTAHSDRVADVGLWQDTVRIETAAGTAEIPVRLQVLEPRPRFMEVALWYVPLFIAAMFPALAVVAAEGRAPDFRMHADAPAATVASGALYLMLLLISAAAELGSGEMLACGLMMAVMCFVLGAAVARPGGVEGSVVHNIVKSGGLFGLLLILQLLTLPRWRIWAAITLLTGIASGFVFLRVLIAG